MSTRTRKSRDNLTTHSLTMTDTTNTVHSREEKCHFTIWQQNINKSRACQHDLISSGKLTSKNVDMVALQEPSVNTFNKTISSKDWKTLYPSTHEREPQKTRSVILIRDNILTDGWEQLDFPSGDVTAIRIKGEWGKATIINVYNDCKHNDTLTMLTDFHRKHTKEILGTLETQAKH